MQHLIPEFLNIVDIRSADLDGSVCDIDHSFDEFAIEKREGGGKRGKKQGRTKGRKGGREKGRKGEREKGR